MPEAQALVLNGLINQGAEAVKQDGPGKASPTDPPSQHTPSKGRNLGASHSASMLNLNMIVRDEAERIEACLASVQDLVRDGGGRHRFPG